MILKTALTVLAALLLPRAGFADEAASDRWVQEQDDVLNIKIGEVSPSLAMKTTPVSGPDTGVEFLPNTSSKTFLGVGYRNLGFTVSKGNPRSDSQVATYGSGDSTDITLQFFGRTWTQQYFYQSYQGYYIKNTAQIVPSAPPDYFIKRPDITTAHYGMNFIYNFQPANYSTAAAFNQSGHQLRSGGAWLAMGSLHNHVFRSNPQLLPSEVSAGFGELATLQRGDLLQLGFGGGGGYTLTSDGRWFISAQILLGLGGVYQNFETAEYDYHETAIGTLGNASLAGGFNGKNNYVTVQVLVDTANYKLPATGLQLSSQQAVFQYGHRFAEVSLPWADRVSALFEY
jgi:hypothetical protein